jgi:hypothetical protein
MKTLVAAAATLAMAVGAVPAQAADKDGGKSSSIFLQCDGRTGHVGAGESFMRLLLVTATAGISEAGMASDDSGKRLKGAAGAAACAQAISSEGDNYRRVQLALARSIHFGEDKNWAAAVEAARAVPGVIAPESTDWALAKSAKATAKLAEATMLAQHGRYAEAEEALVGAAEVGELEVTNLQRALRMMGFDRTMTPRKKAVLERTFRVMPSEGLTIASHFAEAGDYSSAVATIDALTGVFNLFAKEPGKTASFESQAALFLALSGKVADSRARLAIARAEAASDAADGSAQKYAVAAAKADETIAATEVALALAEHRDADARRLFAARERWALIPQGVAATLAGRVAAVTPAAERSGLLAKGDEGLWAETRQARAKLLSEETAEKLLWALTNRLTVDRRYTELSGQVWSATKKPKLLLKGKPEDRIEILSIATRAYGAQAGEALLLHAALIARTRGKHGFVMVPVRERVDMMGVKFVSASEAGVPAGALVSADEVIAALGSRIPRPQKSSGVLVPNTRN